MYRCLIIADDLTGANATISLLKNLKITTLLDLNDKNLYKNYDAISCSTESRSISEFDAYNKVFNITKKYMHENIIVYNKRIDSTMRGNVGIEIDAMLDALDDDRIAIVSPAYPSAGRTVVGGYLLVNGVLVEDTEMAVDSKNPIKISNVIDLIKAQSKRKIISMSIDIVRKSVKVIANFIKDKYKEGFRIFVCDMINENHINSISQAVLESKIKFIVADPSPLTAKISELSITKKKYDKISYALDEVERKGYGIVTPSIDELVLEEPEMVKQGSRFGVRLKATAPSIHLIKTNVQTEVSPIVGSEKQSEELVNYLLSGFENDPKKIWESNIFGKSLNELVNEGLQAKLAKMPEDAQIKLQETLERIVNEGSGGLICIIL